MTFNLETTTTSRRRFLQTGSLLLAGSAMGSARQLWAGEKGEVKPKLRVGLLTDVHYADRNPGGSRFYRESLGKVREAVGKFKAAKIDLAVELGDFIDAAPTVKEEQGFLQTIQKEFAALDCPRHYVLGNHCVYTLTKDEFLEGCGAKKSFYSFDAGGFHFVVLDACFTSKGEPYGRKNFVWTDPNISGDELDWLDADLKAATKPTVVFVHQRLDTADHYGIKNAPAVRKVLEKSQLVTAVFQGHNHKNDHKQISGIDYVTLAAVVQGSGATNNAYCLLDFLPNGTLRLDGFRQQKDYTGL